MNFRYLKISVSCFSYHFGVRFQFINTHSGFEWGSENVRNMLRSNCWANGNDNNIWLNGMGFIGIRINNSNMMLENAQVGIRSSLLQNLQLLWTKHQAQDYVGRSSDENTAPARMEERHHRRDLCERCKLLGYFCGKNDNLIKFSNQKSCPNQVRVKKEREN